MSQSSNPNPMSSGSGSRGGGLSGVGGALKQMAPTGAALIMVLIVGFLGILYATCTQYIEPDQFAVVQVDVSMPLFTGPSGIHTNIYDTGIHWRMPGCEKYLVFPKSVRAVTLHGKGKSQETPELFVRYEDAAHIQTSDGFFINLDVSILYHVVDPYLVVHKFGAGNLYEQNGIVLQAEPTMKSTMGTLHPEDFFDATKRVAKQDETRDRFNELVKSWGLRVDHVLIRYPQYHEAVQSRIEARNIQEQTKQKNIEETKLALALADLKEVVNQGEAGLSMKLMDGSNSVTRLNANMESYRRKRQSDGNRVIALAEAEKQRMINDAYQGVGADRLIGLEWAKVLGGLDTIVLESGGQNGFNPLDMESLMKQLKIKPQEKK